MPDIIIFSFTVALCFFLGLLCFFYLPVNKRGNSWIGIFLVSTGFALLSKIIWDERLYISYPHIIPISELSRFLIAPCFYLGIWNYTNLHPMNRRNLLMHFIPAVVFFVFVSLPYFTVSANLNANIGSTATNALAVIMKVIIPVQVIIYWIASYNQLKKHKKHIKIFSSSVDDKNLSWVFGILLWMLLIIISWLILRIPEMALYNSPDKYLYLLLILFMGYNLLSQKEVFLGTETDNAALDSIIKTEHSNADPRTIPRLSEKASAAYKIKLDDLLKEDEIFTNPDINLAELSSMMNLSMNDLSFLINSMYEMNFYSLINYHRIEKTKSMMLKSEYKHLTILGIAFEAGFTSKSTFNQVFKKMTGLTPSAYLKAHRT